MYDMDKPSTISPSRAICPKCDFMTLNWKGQVSGTYPCHHCGYVMENKEICPPHIWDGVEYEPCMCGLYKEYPKIVLELPPKEKIKEMMRR